MSRFKRNKSHQSPPPPSPVPLEYAAETPTHHLANSPPTSTWYATLGSIVGGIYTSVVLLFLVGLFGYAFFAWALAAIGETRDSVGAPVFFIVATIALGLLTAKYVRRSLRLQADSLRVYWITMATCHGLACAGMAIGAVRLLR